MSLSLGNTSGTKSHDFTPTTVAPAPATYQIAKMAKIACPSQRHPGGSDTATRLPRSRRSDGDPRPTRQAASIGPSLATHLAATMVEPW